MDSIQQNLLALVSCLNSNQDDKLGNEEDETSIRREDEIGMLEELEKADLSQSFHLERHFWKLFDDNEREKFFFMS